MIEFATSRFNRDNPFCADWFCIDERRAWLFFTFMPSEDNLTDNLHREFVPRLHYLVNSRLSLEQLPV